MELRGTKMPGRMPFTLWSPILLGQAGRLATVARPQVEVISPVLRIIDEENVVMESLEWKHRTRCGRLSSFASIV
jgi:hypothetical protein